MSDRGARRHSRRLGAVAIFGSAALLVAAGCTRRPPTENPTPTWSVPTPTAPPTTDGHGHTDDDHANQTTTTMGGGMDHGGGDHGGGDHGGGGGTAPDPTGGMSKSNNYGAPAGLSQAQIDRAVKLIESTRASAKAKGLDTVAGVQRAGYISIGDEMTGTTHYVMPKYHYDAYELNSEYIESFAVRDGKVIAAMYILSNGKTMAQVPELAGEWSTWHNHTLPFRSSNQYDDNYYRLGGGAMRTTAPMAHVWLVSNECGPFAGTDTKNMTGSCPAHGGH